jgi:hypothetical protein
MLAPIDKIRRGGNDIIQVVITTACDRNCSNCTQLLPFRADYRFMSVDCFREVVESLRDWPGVVAMFGGNPCVHPNFPAFCRILAEAIPPTRRGLWTNHLFKHGAIAAETFGKGRLNLNAHGNPEAAAEIEKWFPGIRPFLWTTGISAFRNPIGYPAASVATLTRSGRQPSSNATASLTRTSAKWPRRSMGFAATITAFLPHRGGGAS